MKPLFDWMVHFGFYPYQPVDCTIDRVASMLTAGGITHAALSSYRGLFYDAADGNSEVAEVVCNLNQRSGTDCSWQAAGTFNPQCGWPKTANCIDGALSQDIKLFRLYPGDQGWTMTHPALIRAVERLNVSPVRAVLMEDQFQAIAALRGLLDERIAIVCSLHFYTMSVWMDALFDLPNVYLTVRRLHGPGVIPAIVSKHGFNRLLYASDIPLGSPGAINKMLASLPDHEELLEGMWKNSNRILEGRS